MQELYGPDALTYKMHALLCDLCTGFTTKYINDSAGGIRSITLVLQKPAEVKATRPKYPRPGFRTASNLEVPVWRVQPATVTFWYEKLKPLKIPSGLPSSPRETDHHGVVL